MRVGVPIRAIFVLVMAFLLAAAAAGPANFAAAQSSATVQIHEGPQSADQPVPHNDTHVCSFHIHGFNFEEGATGTWTISNWPGGETVYKTGTYGPVGASGEWYSAQMYDTDLNGFGHYRLDTTPAGGTQNFWVDESECAPAPEDGTITVRKYEDLDGDGQKNNDDSWLSGWTFTVKQGSTVIDSGQTGADGTKSFSVPAGTYDVFETLQTGWTNTEPGDGKYLGVAVTSGQTQTLDFGNQVIPTPGQGTISVFKYNDLNKDGNRDEGEAGLQGWVFTVKDGEGVTVDTMTTDSTGAAELLVDVGDSYSVCETTKAGWVNTEPGGTAPYCYSDISVYEEETSGPYDFGNYQTSTPTNPPQPTSQPTAGTLQVNKFNDLNRNGVKDTGEPMLAAVSFLVKYGGTTQLTIATSASGIATATLAAGVYNIVEVPQAGWTATTAVNQQATITVGNTTVLNFGNAQVIIPPTTATLLTVTKYLDANANGVRDAGEVTLAGFSFLVKSTDGAVSQTITSDANGVASIANLPLGGYSVTEVAKSGYTNTDPGGNATKYFALATGSTTAALSFGNAEVKLPSTSTDPNTTGLALSLTLMAGIALMFVMARRSAHLS